MSSGRDAEQERDRQFTALAAAWLYTHRSWNTRAAYEADLAHFAAWCANRRRAPMDVTTEDVAQYRNDSAAEGAGRPTVARRLSALASFYRYAEEADEVETNPAAGVARPEALTGGKTEELDGPERRALVAAAGDLNPKTVAVVELLLFDGLKLGEALSADAEDFSDPPPVLAVSRRGRLHPIGLSATSAAAVEAYLAARTTGPLFLSDTPGREHQRLTRAGAHYLLKQAAARAQLTKPVSANTLRRSYAATEHEAGVALEDIQHNMGHYDRRTTRRLLPQNAQNPACNDHKEVPE